MSHILAEFPVPAAHVMGHITLSQSAVTICCHTGHKAHIELCIIGQAALSNQGSLYYQALKNQWGQGWGGK